MKPRKDIRGSAAPTGATPICWPRSSTTSTPSTTTSRNSNLCDVDWSRWAPRSFDFITCTDVLEHVEPPLDDVFDNMYRLLKPGGVAILTVPTSLGTRHARTFPRSARLADRDRRRPASAGEPPRATATIERFDDLCFHGGEGLTLEFRLFSRKGLIESATAAGFLPPTVLDASVETYAIPLCARQLRACGPKAPRRGRSGGRMPAARPPADRSPPDARSLSGGDRDSDAKAGDPGCHYAPLYRLDEQGYWLHVPRWLCDDYGPRADRGEKLKCLDVGCAYGTLLLYAAKMFHCEPYAVDFVRYLDPTLVEDYGIHYQINNIEREPFPWDVQFDAIVITEVLEHFNFNALPTLKKLRALLAPGGRLYLSTPDASQWGRQTKYYSCYAKLPMPSADPAFPVIDDHVWQFNEAELRELVGAAGFRVVRFDYAPGSGRRHFNMAIEPC